jgi:hypothetical protein
MSREHRECWLDFRALTHTHTHTQEDNQQQQQVSKTTSTKQQTLNREASCSGVRASSPSISGKVVTNLLMREMRRVKSSEYSPDAMASKHSMAVVLEPGGRTGEKRNKFTAICLSSDQTAYITAEAWNTLLTPVSV